MSGEWRYDPNTGTFRRDGGMDHNQKKKENSWLSWGLIVASFVFGLWPVGLVLLIMKLRDEPAKKRNVNRNTASYADSQVRPTASSGPARKTTQRPAENRVVEAAKQVTKTPSDKGKTARVLQIAGGAVMGFFGILLLSYLGDLFNMGLGGVDWSGFMSVAGCFAGGAVSFFAGRKMLRRKNRVARYQAILGNRDYVTLDELIAVTGKKRNVVESDIEYMLQKNLLETGAFLDQGHGILFRSADAYQRYLTERTQKEELTPKEANEGYAGALRAIREANDRIPDPVFSEKLDHMERIAGKIFREVETHPEKQKQASTFFDYYLPTTLKLLGTYTEFEAAGIEGENLRSAKERIESIMDNLLENFERQLDELYRSEALDVDADIRVMESMLARDLSSVEQDFGLGSAAVQREPE